MIPFPSFHQFEVIRLIGSGGMASVYEALDRKLARKVALKVIHPHLCQNESAVERFRREALAAARMDHPNIVRIYDYLQEAGQNAMVMEYVPGTDCGSLIKKKGALPFDFSSFIMFGTALALQEAHLHEFLHRDVKPSNILLHRKNRVLLSDFGLARRSMDTHLTLSHDVAGTPGFMSPEHVTGKKVSFPSDIYAWGVSFYYLLMGRLPYDTTELAPLLNAIQEGRICLDEAVLEKVPGRYYAVIQQCLMRDPEKRIQNGRDLVIKLEEAGGHPRADLTPWIESVAGEQPQEGPRARPQPTLLYRPWKQRLWKMAVPVLAVMAALAAIAGIFLFRGSGAKPAPPSAASPPETVAARHGRAGEAGPGRGPGFGRAFHILFALGQHRDRREIRGQDAPGNPHFLAKGKAFN